MNAAIQRRPTGPWLQAQRNRRSEELGGVASFTGSELDALRQRQLRGKVNRVRLAAHVILPAITATLASAAGIFLPAERATDLRPTCAGVHVCNSAIAAHGTNEFLGFAHVVGENG